MGWEGTIRVLDAVHGSELLSLPGAVPGSDRLEPRRPVSGDDYRPRGDNQDLRCFSRLCAVKESSGPRNRRAREIDRRQNK